MISKPTPCQWLGAQPSDPCMQDLVTTIGIPLKKFFLFPCGNR